MGVAQYPGGQARQVGGELSSRDRVGRVDAEGGTPVAVGAQDGRLHFQNCAVAEAASRRRGRQVGAAPSQIASEGVCQPCGNTDSVSARGRGGGDRSAANDRSTGRCRPAGTDGLGRRRPTAVATRVASVPRSRPGMPGRTATAAARDTPAPSALRCSVIRRRSRSGPPPSSTAMWRSRPRNWSAGLEPGPPATPSATSTTPAYRTSAPRDRPRPEHRPRRRDGAPPAPRGRSRDLRPGGVAPGSGKLEPSGSDDRHTSRMHY